MLHFPSHLFVSSSLPPPLHPPPPNALAFPSNSNTNRAPSHKPQICLSHLHAWVTHGMACSKDGSISDEEAGCDIPAYTSRFTAVHWNLKHKRGDLLDGEFAVVPATKRKASRFPTFVLGLLSPS